MHIATGYDERKRRLVGEDARIEAEKAEVLRKAQEQNAALIKSAVIEATAGIVKENESLRKALNEQSALIKSMAAQPKASTAITSMAALSKGSPVAAAANHYTKRDVLDAAEGLIAKGMLPIEAITELEQTSRLYDPEHRAILERALTRK